MNGKGVSSLMQTNKALSTCLKVWGGPDLLQRIAAVEKRERRVDILLRVSADTIRTSQAIFMTVALIRIQGHTQFTIGAAFFLETRRIPSRIEDIGHVLAHYGLTFHTCLSCLTSRDLKTFLDVPLHPGITSDLHAGHISWGTRAASIKNTVSKSRIITPINAAEERFVWGRIQEQTPFDL